MELDALFIDINNMKPINDNSTKSKSYVYRCIIKKYSEKLKDLTGILFIKENMLWNVNPLRLEGWAFRIIKEYEYHLAEEIKHKKRTKRKIRLVKD